MSAADPRGKRALFSDAAGPADISPDSGGLDVTGKAALYSTAVRRPGTLVLECSSCHGRTRVGYLDFARRHLPLWLWAPWRHHSRLMACPACGRRTWLAASWLE